MPSFINQNLAPVEGGAASNSVIHGTLPTSSKHFVEEHQVKIGKEASGKNVRVLKVRDFSEQMLLRDGSV